MSNDVKFFETPCIQYNVNTTANCWCSSEKCSMTSIVRAVKYLNISVLLNKYTIMYILFKKSRLFTESKQMG